MQKKKWFKKAVSGMLTAVTLLTSVVAPIPAMAAEITPEENLAAYVSALPQMDEVADQLDAGELVTAATYEVEVGAEIDLKTDFTEITYDNEKVKVTFYEAESEGGQDFSTSHADTYKATYYAQPVSGNQAYRFNRPVIVKEPMTKESQTEPGGGSGGEKADTEAESEDADADLSQEMTFETMTTLEAESIAEAISEAATEEAEVVETQDTEETAAEMEDSEVAPTAEAEPETTDTAEALPESELDAALEAAEDQETYDWESGLTLSGVLIWATEEEGIDLAGMESGSSVSFQMPGRRKAAAASTQTVDITKGSDYY